MKNALFFITQYLLLFIGAWRFFYADTVRAALMHFFSYGTFIVLLQMDWYWIRDSKKLNTIIFILELTTLVVLSHIAQTWVFIPSLVLSLTRAQKDSLIFSSIYSEEVKQEEESLRVFTSTKLRNIIIIAVLSIIFSVLLKQWEGIFFSLAIGFLASMYFLSQYHLNLLTQKEHKLVQLGRIRDKEKQELEESVGSLAQVYTLKERNRISREIHDSAGHCLSTIIIQLGAVSALLKQDMSEKSKERQIQQQEQIAEMTTNLRGFAQEGLEEIRGVLAANKPRKMEGSQLVVALEDLIEKSRNNTGLRIDFTAQLKDFELEEEEELTIYRIVQESLSNSVRHAKASHVKIYLIQNNKTLLLTIQDNGEGTDAILPHVGLRGIEERVAEIEGQIQFSSEKGQGFLTHFILKSKELR